MNVKDIVTKNPDCILYFGDNKDLFLSALEDVGTSKMDIDAISHNAEFELETKKLPAHYVIVVKEGNGRNGMLSIAKNTSAKNFGVGTALHTTFRFSTLC